MSAAPVRTPQLLPQSFRYSVVPFQVGLAVILESSPLKKQS